MSATYSAATIKRARTILANCEAKQSTVVKQAIVSTRDAKRDAQMATRKASNGQRHRINDRHAERGLRQYKTLAAFRRVFPTMLDASLYNDEFKS